MNKTAQYISDEAYMRRCFSLAHLGAGAVSPNPLVGAVLVHQGQIIGEGWHQKWGGPHAEVACIASVLPQKKALIPYSTLYCNLEPCAHVGKTPPCVSLILDHKIPRVVVSNTDPNPLVAGKGLENLVLAGVSVTKNVLPEEGAWLNRIFFTSITQLRPYIILKWAQSADGFMAKTGEKTPITGAATQTMVHRWRAESDAILVGTRTALTDNPRLNTRMYGGKNPLRVVFDLNSTIPLENHLLDDAIPTWVYGPARQGKSWKNTQFIPSNGPVSLKNLCADLHESQKASLLVEGGSHLIQQFLASGKWDEIRVLENPKHLIKGVSAPTIPVHSVLKAAGRTGDDRWKIFTQNLPNLQAST